MGCQRIRFQRFECELQGFADDSGEGAQLQVDFQNGSAGSFPRDGFRYVDNALRYSGFVHKTTAP